MTDLPAPDRSGPVTRMSGVDAVLWALQADAVLRATIVVVGVLDHFPGREAVAAHLERASRRLPRLRQRVVPSPIGLAPPRWELDHAFDLDYHLRAAGVASDGPAGLDELLALAEPAASEGFDPARPPWQIVLVEGLAGGRAGIVAKLHHALTDGVGAVRLAMSIFDLEGQADPGAMPPRPDEPLSTDVERAVDDLDYEARRSLDTARRVLPWLARGLRGAVSSPETQVRGVIDMTRSVARATAPGIRPLSPVMTGRSLRTRLRVLSFDLEALKAAGRAGGGGPAGAGGTVNDAFLAAVAGGLRRYHEKHGYRPDALRVGIAVNRRSRDDTEMFGNAFTPLRLLLPLQIADPSERVAAVGALVRRSLDEPAVGMFTTLASVAGSLSRMATVSALASVLRSTDVVASNVPGSPVALFLAGAEVERLIAFGPRSGAALNLTLLSHHGAVEVGVNMDLLALPDPDTLVSCLGAGFDEVLELG